MLDWASILILFIFGTILGSFLNALAFRYNTGRSMWGRSGCATCGATLGAFDLVPLFSYVGLRGRCRKCKARISVQYPLIEGIAGLIAVLSYWHAGGDSLIFVGTLLFFGILLFIAIYDFHHTIIPDPFVYTAAAIALMLAVLQSQNTEALLWTLSAGPLLALIPALLWLVSKGQWMGLGDAKLFLAGGFFLGLSHGIAAFMLSFWIGAIVSVLLLFIARASYSGRRGGTMKHEVPFGPFIVFAIGLVYFADIGLYDILSYFQTI